MSVAEDSVRKTGHGVVGVRCAIGVATAGLLGDVVCCDGVADAWLAVGVLRIAILLGTYSGARLRAKENSPRRRSYRHSAVPHQR